MDECRSLTQSQKNENAKDRGHRPLLSGLRHDTPAQGGSCLALVSTRAPLVPQLERLWYCSPSVSFASVS